MSLTQIAGLLPKPDPARVTEGNRRIKEAHARAFGDYVREERDWVAPALVLRAPDIFEFDVRESIGGTDFGIISFPRLASTDLRILDGQHGILGVHLAIQGIANQLEKARGALAAARRNEALPAAIHQCEDEIRKLEGLVPTAGADASTSDGIAGISEAAKKFRRTLLTALALVLA